ncbi:hypothetical protein WS83_07710 [Burkholderia sp. MSMB2042]|nr:hypothetical protein WS78_22875 [Burkholderia savannae]KVG47671.1 hypothetical protein WS77_27460 [Burkholderia sp. MSMB0265]KVG80557.1 hypothetical protein WS81_12800 [Burkholderia sp. MSMB2040]KVG93979.1 hypothetical protein WS83_07710 [Burkholderia sp. MSMB2042]KVG96622.1 hypothetical protein WS82_31390 [Burkholderia sp. MSMB2041]
MRIAIMSLAHLVSVRVDAGVFAGIRRLVQRRAASRAMRYGALRPHRACRSIESTWPNQQSRID